jgi:hypothetical protein
MTTTYDPAYSTTVSFNKPIMLGMMKARDITLVQHWLDNGEPNKKLATAAFTKAIDMQWIEALELIWSKDWLTQKGMITIACNHVVAITMYGRCPEFHDSISHNWVMDKAFSNILSKAQKNALFLSLIELCIKNRNEYYWNIFYNDDMVFKGSTSEDIIGSCIYILGQQNNEYNNYDMDKELALKQLDTILSNKNGIQISDNNLISVLTDYKRKDFDLFFKLIEVNKLIMDEKDLFILATECSIFFKAVFPRFREYKEIREQDPDFCDSAFKRTMKAFIKAGLPEKVQFSKKDLEDKYAYSFEGGYISLRKYSYSTDLSLEARQFPRTYSGYSLRDKIVPVTFETGVAIFSELKPSDKPYDKVFKQPTETDLKIMAESFKNLKDELNKELI